MMSIVYLCLPWCRYLHVLPGVTSISPFPSSLLHQVHADNLECISSVPMQQMRAAQFYSAYVRLVGQEPAPSECVLMSTSAAVRRDMKGWLISEQGERWSVKLDVQDLGGYLDATCRAWGRTLVARVLAVLLVVWLVSALPLVFIGGSFAFCEQSTFRQRFMGLRPHFFHFPFEFPIRPIRRRIN